MEGLTIEFLKGELKKHNLPITGLKAELLERYRSIGTRQTQVEDYQPAKHKMQDSNHCNAKKPKIISNDTEASLVSEAFSQEQNADCMDDDDSEELYQIPKIKDLSEIEHHLATINRTLLDFDFEKLCCVSLQNINIYCCLVCGKFLQGRGKSSHAYFHSMNEDHHVFLNLETLETWILPDLVKISHPSLNDIFYALKPTYTSEDVNNLKNTEKSIDLHGKEYIPGYVGLNDIKNNDFVNVIVHAISQVEIVRKYFLLGKEKKGSELVKRFGMLLRKIWNPKAFKGHVSPHEFIQEVSNSSKKRFKLGVQSDAIEFLSWLLNTLHFGLGGTKKPISSVIYRAFQGEIYMDTQAARHNEDLEIIKHFDDQFPIKTSSTPFLFLSLDLPMQPLFEAEESIVPQISISALLSKYVGEVIVVFMLF